MCYAFWEKIMIIMNLGTRTLTGLSLAFEHTPKTLRFSYILVAQYSQLGGARSLFSFSIQRFVRYLPASSVTWWMWKWAFVLAKPLFMLITPNAVQLLCIITVYVCVCVRFGEVCGDVEFEENKRTSEQPQCPRFTRPSGSQVGVKPQDTPSTPTFLHHIIH